MRPGMGSTTVSAVQAWCLGSSSSCAASTASMCRLAALPSIAKRAFMPACPFMR
jgi:hypothetical protein